MLVLMYCDLVLVLLHCKYIGRWYNIVYVNSGSVCVGRNGT